MKYKAGDRVVIKSKEWYRMNMDLGRQRVDVDGVFFTKGMESSCGKDFIIEEVTPSGYTMRGYEGFTFTDGMIECLVERRESKYPHVCGQCKEVFTNYDYYYHIRNLSTLRTLIICRDAYWKIAGKEMGLGKPWQPDYDSGADKFGIVCYDGIVQKCGPEPHWSRHLNKVLDFPTAEMRDAFYENFKELIKKCKELI